MTAASGYREAFARRATPYDQAMVRWPGVRDEEFDLAVDLLDAAPGDIVLDVPTGGGYLASRLPSGARLVGVDPSATFAAAARAHTSAVVQAEPGMLPLGAGTVDRIVSLAGVHHEHDLVGLLGGWRRVLVPGGRLVLIDVAEGSAEATFLDDVVGRWNGEGHAGRYLGGDVAGDVERAGFTVASLHDARYHWWAPDLDALVGFCSTLFGLRAVAPSDVADALRAGPGVDVGADGRVGLRWGLRAVVATAA